MVKEMLNTLIMRGGRKSYTIMSGYYKYFTASLINNGSARNFVLECYEGKRMGSSGDDSLHAKSASREHTSRK